MLSLPTSNSTILAFKKITITVNAEINISFIK